MRNVRFNYKDLSEFIVITDVKESLMPSFSSSRAKLANARGSKFIKQVMNERTIEVDCYLIADSMEERREALKGLSYALYTEKPAQLYLDNERYYMAIYEGESIIENIAYDGIFTLQFVALDPIAYGNEIKIKNIKSNTIYHNAGNFESYGVFYLGATSSKVKVSLSGSPKKFIEISGVSIGEGITINMRTGKVEGTKSGNLMSYVNAMGETFAIPPGRFQIEITGAWGDLIFKERWL